MTPKEYLSQLRLKNAAINALIERQARYRDLAARRTAVYRSGPGGQRRVSSVEEYACRVVDLEAEIDRRIDAYVDLTQEIEAAIDAVSDPRYRELLRFRYINGWSWTKIAREMHMDDRWIRRLHGRALQQIAVPEQTRPEKPGFLR